MVSVRIEERSSFAVVGMKCWISGTDNEAFSAFWKKAHQEGHVERIKKYCDQTSGSQTRSAIVGLSCTEDDPSVRSFWFFVAAETKLREVPERYELHNVGAHRWAIFSNDKNNVEALLECEMYAWKEWLGSNREYEHDNGPEIEAYFDEEKIEYWIPVRERRC
jgi:AraC family transcriptional regulator